MKANEFFSVTKQSVQEWLEDRAPNEAAALAYYAMISVPAMLLLIQWLLGRVVGDQVQEQVIDFIQQAVRGGGADAIATIVESGDAPGAGLAAVASLATLAFSATGVVVNLEQALNRMWEIVEEDMSIGQRIIKRLSSLLVVLLLGLFLVLSVVASTIVTAFAEPLQDLLPFGSWVLQVINVLLSLLLLTLLFGATMKYLPDAIVAWRDVWLGAAVTAVLFIIGQFVLSQYLGRSAPGSAYGVAGSVVALLVWIYYSAMILFLGAEFTQVYANRYGSKIKPDEDAITLEEEFRREQAAPSEEGMETGD